MRFISTVLMYGVLLVTLVERGVFAQDDCEVCIGFITKFSDQLSESEKKTPAKIEVNFRNYCKATKNGRENRFCYYVGGLEESATGILGEMSKPLSWGLPVDKICDKLKKKDSQICELRYEKQIDLSKVDLKKLKVRDLKKILSDWDESCEDCLEKGDFIRFIEERKSKYIKSEL